MALSDVKTLTSERNAAYVKSNQGRRLNGTVEQNKDAFDKFPQLNMDKHNELVDLLIALGLDSISTDISSRYTKEETNTKISEETTDLIKTISYTKGDGKFKITTKGGVVTEIDTDLEKIPASFELMEIEGRTYLRITNQDGTYTQTEVTSLLNVYSFSDSDTIDFTESPKYSVTAIVKPNSITIDHLSLAAVSTLEGYVSAAAGSANSAAGSASAAETSANNASTFNQSAKGYSESAAASKASASESAASAENAATIANQKATAADTSAILSQSYAKGGTGTRAGEDADNAKYYMEQAKAAAGGDFATKTELTEGLGTKVDKVSGKQLSTNDYTTTDKNKVANLPANTATALNGKIGKVTPAAAGNLPTLTADGQLADSGKKADEINTLFIITLTINNETGTITADKSYNEMKTAYEAGKELVCKFVNDSNNAVVRLATILNSAYGYNFCFSTVSGDTIHSASSIINYVRDADNPNGKWEIGAGFLVPTGYGQSGKFIGVGSAGYPEWQSLYTLLTGTLSAGSTTLTLQNAAITINSVYDIYTDKWGVNPTDVVVTAGKITLTFEKQNASLCVRVEVR